jgi:hypothetical protein
VFEPFFITGASNDKTLYNASKWEEKLKQLLTGNHAVYGDSGFGLSEKLHRNLRANEDPDYYREKNRAMSAVRISVEWGIGDIKGTFAFVTFTTAMKVGNKQVGNYFLFCTLMQNIRVCLYQKSRISKLFDYAPPTLDEYLPLAAV